MEEWSESSQGKRPTRLWSDGSGLLPTPLTIEETMMSHEISRRRILQGTGVAAGSALAAALTRPGWSVRTVGAQGAAEEYVWLSANANLPLFVAHDHPALNQIGKELGVKVTIAGPSTVDIPGLVAAVEQATARKPSA